MKWTRIASAPKFKVGDIVIIKECRPISKTKRFEVSEKVGSVGSVEEDKIVGEEVLGAEEPKEEETEKVES